MFGFLKKAISGLVEKVSKKVEPAQVEAPKIPEQEEPIKAIEDAESEVPLSFDRPEPPKVEIPPQPEPEKPKELEQQKPQGILGSIVGTVKSIAEGAKKAVVERELNEAELEPLLQDFELQLIQSNVAPEVAEKICQKLKKVWVGQRIARSGRVDEILGNGLKEAIMEILDQPTVDLLEKIQAAERPLLILFLGFNGAGKTTSIAKLGKLLQGRGLKVLLAAGDTFRAAAMEQLEIHGNRLGIKVIKQQYGADAAAVVFDAMKYAEAHGMDVVLADTAGRQHTNTNLIGELKKICRVNNPGIKILVLDALSGSDIIHQSALFNEAVDGIDGIILTKVDVDEKGGAILSAMHTLNKPILFLGVGQEYENFEMFDPKKYVNGLFAS